MESVPADVRSVIETLRHPKPGCDSCALHTGCRSPFMSGRGQSDRPLLAIVGEAPGAVDDNRDTPFCGTAGELLEAAMEELSIDQNRVWITNAVRCRPRDGKPTERQIKACQPFLVEELRAVRPVVIVALGNGALSTLTGRRGINSERGEIFEWENGTPVVPTYHPNYLAHNPAAMDFVLEDIRKAWDIALSGGEIRPPVPVDYRVVRSMEDLEALKLELLDAERVAWDIETTGLRPYAEDAKVLCVTLSTRPYTGWLLPIDHPERTIRRDDAISLLKWLLEVHDVPLVGQNLKFDMGYLRANLGITPRRPAFDCQIAHHLLDEDASKSGGNGLKSMAWRYTDRGGYERRVERKYARPGQEFYERMAEVPLEDPDDPEGCLKHYACADVDVCLRVQDALMPKLRKEQLLDVMELELDKQMMLTELEVMGASIDWEYHRAMTVAFPERLKAIVDRLRDFPEVKACEEKYATTRKTKGKVKVEPFNVNSPNQVRLLCLDILQLPLSEDSKRTKGGEYSVDKEVLAGWLDQLPQRSPKRQVVQLLAQAKRLEKLHSAYIEPLPRFLDRDGKIHTTFDQCYVATWRLSSKHPNLQQLPRDDDDVAEGGVGKGDIKRLFIGAKPGWWVAEADYSQIELRVAGLISQDDVMIANYVHNEDLHRRTAAGIYGVRPEDVTDAQRTAAKIINFGILFGMGAPTLAAKLGCSVRQAEKMIEAFYATYRNFDRWTTATRKHLMEHGWTASMFGHRRHLPNVWAPDRKVREHALRQGINFPIQCTASNLTMYAEAYLNRLFQEDGMESRCFGQVHDSIWLTGPPEEQQLATKMVRLVMENTGFPFLTGEDPRWPKPVPIKAEVKVGMNLRDMQKLEE